MIEAGFTLSVKLLEVESVRKHTLFSIILLFPLYNSGASTVAIKGFTSALDKTEGVGRPLLVAGKYNRRCDLVY